MNVQKSKLCFLTFLLTFLVVSISACSSATPKPGYWANEDGAYGEAITSFDLSDAGSISNFSITATFGTPLQTCKMEIDQLQMEVSDDGTFAISHSMEYADLETELGPAVMSLDWFPEGQPSEVLRISGNISNTTMDGTFEISVCNHVLFGADNTGIWKAQWKTP